VQNSRSASKGGGVGGGKKCRNGTELASDKVFWGPLRGLKKKISRGAQRSQWKGETWGKEERKRKAEEGRGNFTANLEGMRREIGQRTMKEGGEISRSARLTANFYERGGGSGKEHLVNGLGEN